MIHIEQITFQNPFDKFPYLKEIWPSASSAIAQEATQETIENQELGLYLVMKDYIPIGMSGFFINSDNIKELGLRWHGIIPSERGHGYSKEAMKLVFEQALLVYPQTEFIVEYIPLVDYNPPIIKHFTQLGFVKIGEVEAPDWAPHRIQGYRVNIRDFLEHCD